MIKAIDAQQVIIQAEQANRIQQIDRQHPEMQQRYLDIQAREERKILQKAITSSEEANRALIREQKEKERREERQNLQENRENSADEENQGDDLPSEEGHINIRV